MSRYQECTTCGKPGHNAASCGQVPALPPTPQHSLPTASPAVPDTIESPPYDGWLETARNLVRTREREEATRNLSKLEVRENGLHITRRKSFSPFRALKETTVATTFDFAYKMSFGEEGEHRDHRSGGHNRRKRGEIFANTFQGKLSEFAVYNTLYGKVDIGIPDVSTYALGQWDDSDFETADNKRISVKSTKKIGSLLLLEAKDWNEEGQYLPDVSQGKPDYDVFILARIEPYCEELMRENRLLYSDEVDREKLKAIVCGETWQYDIPGYVTRGDLVHAIKNDFVIKQGDMLNGRTRMDADNYYIQVGDMKDISGIDAYLRGEAQ